MACDLFKRDDLDYEFCYRELRKLKCDKQTLTSYLRMLLFDVITRQIDRNSCNFGFYNTISGHTRMYRLYDNGLALFAYGVAGLNRTEFATRLGNSNDIKNFAVRELKKLGVSKVFKISFKESNLEAYLNIHKEEIESCLAIDIKSIVKWAADRYEEIITLMNSDLV